MSPDRSTLAERDDAWLSDRLVDGPPCLRLAQLPTPVERKPWLDHGEAEVWIKRDDLTSELYGGGKVRKLEWSLANAPYRGDQPITSVGGIGSNHLVALGLYLEQMGRRMHAVVADQPWTEHTKLNLATMASLDSSFWYVTSRWGMPLAWVAFHVRRRPELGTYLPPGGSTPLAGFGFVNAGLELAAQIRDGQMPRPTTVFVTGGTGGTAAGLAIGLALGQVRTHVAVVSAVEPMLCNRWLMSLRLFEIHRELRKHGLGGPDRVERLLVRAGVRWSIDHTHAGRCYGAPTDEGRAMIELAREHGLSLDPTYTSKCVAGLAASRVRGPVLFWHTHAHTDLSQHIRPDWQSALPDRLRRKVATWEAEAPSASPAASATSPSAAP